MMRSGKRVIGAAAVLLMAGIGWAAAQSPEQIIKDRQANYKAIGDQMKAIKGVVDKDGPATAAVAPAKDIQARIAKIQSLFPPGTDKGGDTHALPTVWSDRAGFDEAAKNAETQATKLVEVAEKGDMKEISAQFNQMGAACGNCHRTFRAKL